MIRKFINWLSQGNNEYELHAELPKNEEAKFILKVDNIRIGTLHCEKGHWFFKYSDEFKKQANIYNPIVGFPDLNTLYKSETLWPFFRIRIPGLKQPAVQEIMKNEKIDQSNEVELLKRFGHKTISNSYELELAL